MSSLMKLTAPTIASDTKPVDRGDHAAWQKILASSLWNGAGSPCSLIGDFGPDSPNYPSDDDPLHRLDPKWSHSGL